MADPTDTELISSSYSQPVTTPSYLTNSADTAATMAAPVEGAAGATGTVANTAAQGSLADIAKAIMNTGTARGAALGALFTQLLKQSGGGQGVVRPMDMSQYAIPGRETTVAAPRFVPYSEYGARDVPVMSDEMMRSFGAPSGLGSLMPTSQYSAMPAMSSREPMTFSSVGTGRNVMPSLEVTPRSNEPISPLTGALLGGALGYLITPESAASAAGARAAGQLYDISGGAIGNIGGLIGDIMAPLRKRPLSTTNPEGERVPVTGSQGETYYQQYGNTYAVSPDGTTRLVYNPSSGAGSAGIYDPDQFGGENPSWMSASNPNYVTSSSSYYNQPSVPSYLTDYVYEPPRGSSSYTYTPSTPNFNSGSSYNNYFNTPPDIYGGTSSSYWAKGGMVTPLMAEGGAVQEPSFYTYGTVVDPMQMISSSQGMAHGGRPQGGLHVPTVEGRHDYRAGSRVMGPGDGQSDDIPAMLADGEYVFDAETVAQLGNGSSKAGSDMLDKFREEIRAHKRSAPVDKIPPPSKSPLQYLKQAQSRSKKNG